MSRKGYLSALMFLGACVAPTKNAPLVGLDELLRDPSKFDGRLVSVAGYVSYEFENCVLWVDQGAFEREEVELAAWFWPKTVSCFGAESHNARQEGRGIVTGKFDASGKGLMDLFPVSINDANFVLVEASNPRMERTREP